MLDLTKCRLLDSGSRMMGLSSEITTVEEGTLLIGVIENGVRVVKPSEGEEDEVVVGFAMSEAINATEAPHVAEVTVPASAPYTRTLPRTPNGTPVVYVNGTKSTTTTFAGNVATFAAADAGKTARIVYRYNLTAAEASALFGGYVSNAAGAIGATGVIHSADLIYTSNYDDSDWWQAEPGPVYTGANGKVSLANTGTLIPGVTVEVAPQAGNGFLGLRVKV